MSSPSESSEGPWPRWLTLAQRVGPETSIVEVLSAVDACLDAEGHWLSRLGNVVAVIRRHLPDLLMVAIYLTARPGTHLELGPHQGPPTFSRQRWGEGVVGSAALERAGQIIGDMKYFPGYIPAYREIHSEIGLPVVRDRVVLAVLNAASIDSGRFGIVEAELLQGVAERLSARWPDAWRAGLPI